MPNQKCLEMESRAWNFIRERYPTSVNVLMRNIVEELCPLIGNSSIVLVGSFSDGRANYIQEGKTVRYISDIDLVIVTRDSIKTIIERRSMISLRLAHLANSLVTSGPTFHIGVRYRKETELPAFAHKVTTLGYPFWQRALWLKSTFPVDYHPGTNPFGIGHCTENICGKLWVVIRYLSPQRGTNRTEASRMVSQQALQCMLESLKYLRRKDSRKMQSLEGWILEPCFVGNVVNNVVRMGRIAERLAQEYQDQCIDASLDEEFDFFRISRKDCKLLPQLLLTLLHLGWKLNNNYAGDVAKRAIRLACCMGIPIIPQQNIDDLRTYYSIRYALAEQRITFSNLFARDRGPEFLNSLGHEP